MFNLILGMILAATAPPVLTMSTTTSVENSGLLDVLVPAFESKYNVEVRYVAVGTGQALRLARDGNADVIFVHDKKREEEFIREGYGTKRFEIMKNYFTVVGPPEFQKQYGEKSLCDLMKAIVSGGHIFVSRGDESGTHSREKSIWESCSLKPGGEGYLEAGSGMIATLRVASEKEAFTLTDTATYLSHMKELNLVPYQKKAPELLNIYSVIPVNPKKHPHVNRNLAETFVRFLLHEEGRGIIRTFGKKKFGECLFVPILPER